jgi:ParB family chromosome partitioning protein
MSEKRRALGRGLGALIPSTPPGDTSSRPVDVFFKDNSAGRDRPSVFGPVSRETGGRADVSRETAAPDQGATASEGRPEYSAQATSAAADVLTSEPAQIPAEWGKSDKSVPGEAGAGVADTDAAAVPERTTQRSDDDLSPAQVESDPRDVARGTDGLAPVPGARFAELPVLSIRPNPRQPRTVFDDDEMAELAHSIAEIGVLQPVVVRPIPADELDEGTAPGDGQERPQFELIMGERRWRATQEAGLSTIPAIIKETHDDDLLRDALLENLHRSQLNALEEAAAYQQLLDDFGCTHDELATRIGRSRPQISNTLRLLKLPPLVQRRVAAGVLSAGHARALLGLPDGAAMERLAQRIVAEGLSVRNVEEIVTIGSNDAPRPARRPRAGARHPQLEDLAARLSDRFDTRVSIALGQRKGKLTVEFASVDDLNRIVELLGADGSARDQG